MTVPTDDTLRDWLLQRLPEADARALEEQLMRDDALAARLREVETDLIDDYARGALDADRARAMREHRLRDADSLERVRIARALAALGAREGDVLGAESATAPSAVSISRRRTRGRAIAVLAIAASVALVALIRREEHSVRPEVASIEPSVTLLATRTRGTVATIVRIPSAASSVRLQLEIADPLPEERYRLRISSKDRESIAAEDLAPRVADGYTYVEAHVPSDTLAPGAHRIELLAQRDAAVAPQQWDVRVERDD